MKTACAAIAEVMSRYCWHVDRGEWSEWLALFADHAVWGMRGARPFEGREALTKLAAGLAKQAAASPPTRHFTSNLLVEANEGTGSLQTYAMVVDATSGAITMVGDYEMELAVQAGGWRITRMIFNLAAPSP